MTHRDLFSRLAALAALPFIRNPKPEPVVYPPGVMLWNLSTVMPEKDAKEIERIKQAFMEKYQGVNAGKLVIIPDSAIMTLNEVRLLRGRPPFPGFSPLA